MKSESVESRKKLPMVPASAEINDFLYVDRARISALYAQLFPQGLLTGIRTTAQTTFSNERDIGTDVKVLKANTKSVDGGSEGIEHQFDASWSIPLEVLARLESLSLVRPSLSGAGLGSIILTDCFLRVIDFSGMENIWSPALNIMITMGQQPQQIIPAMVPLISEAMKAMPRAIHAHFLTGGGLLWGSLQPQSLTIPITDLTLKYGGSVSGSWKLLYIFDAWADKGEAPNTEGWSAGEVVDGILAGIHGLRTLIGRPPGWFGITPLMIYRSVSGWLPTASETESA